MCEYLWTIAVVDQIERQIERIAGDFDADHFDGREVMAEQEEVKYVVVDPYGPGRMFVQALRYVEKNVGKHHQGEGHPRPRKKWLECRPARHVQSRHPNRLRVRSGEQMNSVNDQSKED